MGILYIFNTTLWDMASKIESSNEMGHELKVRFLRKLF